MGKHNRTKYAIALDLGTTTLSAALVDTETGETIKTVSAVNHQNCYGADVIARIKAACEGRGEKLQKLVTEDIEELFRELIQDRPLPEKIVISGNTTMQHLLEGLPCEGLGTYPYQPVDLMLRERKGPSESGIKSGSMVYLPGISAFAGADLVSGIVACGMDRREEISVLMDLGTNGEMAIGNRDRILVASTAAGPVFEGGSIRYGMPAVAGAISDVNIEGENICISTIEDYPAMGICGSGVIAVVYELYKEGIMDATGLLAESYFESGYPLTMNIMGPDIVFTQKDVRQVQMAKAAIRCGLETLIRAYGIDAAQVDRVFLAGGLGAAIDGKKAAGIGLLPKELTEKIVAAGNTSLQGAIMSAAGEDPQRYSKVAESAEEILLAENDFFKETFMTYLDFPA